MVSSHDTLEDHIRTNFNFMYFHRLSLVDLENMMPWERDVYIMLYADQLTKEKEREQNGQN